MIINGVEIPDIDVCDYETMERYEAAHDVVLDKMNKLVTKGKRTSELIKYQCEAVFEFLDSVFGDGTAKKVFGDSVNLRTCLIAYEEVCVSVSDLDKKSSVEIKKHYSKFNHQKQNGGKIYPNPNYHHKKKKRR